MLTEEKSLKTQIYLGRAVICACVFSLASISLLAQGQGQAQGQGPGRPSDEDPGFKVAIYSRNPIEGAPTKGGTASLSPIINHNGPVMYAPMAYLIWYGNWGQ